MPDERVGKKKSIQKIKCKITGHHHTAKAVGVVSLTAYQIVRQNDIQN